MFEGCFTALVTPFAEGRVDKAALKRIVDEQIAGGISGLVPCGTTGEAPTLTEAEQVDVIRTVADRANGRVPVIAGTGSNCTAKTINCSRAALDAGANAVMVVTPYYNKPNPEGLYQHFAAVAEAVDAPMILYNIPGRCAIEIPTETIVRLRATYSNIVAVKHATGNVDGASLLASQSDITILSGDDPLTLPLMSIGARGVISVMSNLMPAAMSALVGAALSGEWASAQRLHAELFPIMRTLLTLDTNPIPIKTAMAIRGVLREEFRLPMCLISPDKRSRLERLIHDLPDSQVSTSARRIA
ncbi:MAG: 4-hydroxy-tetrahydrodipicolinate synthase [Phycisphaerales bacterium]|nr:4-hydroxy-tetrahydrodipicolinate synthase [Phycisphaerales bacterium]MCB9855890.1 4-hydroxy-tetrahydrodipicolinate synthase [Phycisphaerales bacterium]